MPAKSKYTNRHSEAARERDDERAMQRKAANEAAREDAKWVDNDNKAAAKRQEKQREQDAKTNEKAMREAEKKAQLAKEEAEVSSKAPKKVTQREIQKNLAKQLAAYEKEKEAMRRATGATSDPTLKTGEVELPDGNLNRQRGVAEIADPKTNISASGSVGEVLQTIQKTDEGLPEDRHIGKRARVLYRTFYNEHLPRVREEKPGMRRTQYNDVIWEMWCKDPSNPFVQRNELRDRERMEEERKWLQEGVSGEDEEEDEKEYEERQ